MSEAKYEGIRELTTEEMREVAGGFFNAKNLGVGQANFGYSNNDINVGVGQVNLRFGD